MSDLPQRIELPTPRVKLGLIAAALLAMAIVTIVSVARLSAIAWVIAAFPVALAVVFVLGIVHGVGLALDSEGFTVRSLFGEKRYFWNNVSDFRIGRRGRVRAIRFNDVTRQDSIAKLRESMGRGNSTISPLVVSGGLKNACVLLNAFHERAMKR